MADYDPNADHVELKSSVKSKVGVKHGKGKRPKRMAVEVHLVDYEGTSPPQHPHNENFIGGVDLSFFVLQHAVAWDMIRKAVLTFALQRVGGNFTEMYPEIQDVLRSAAAGIITPTTGDILKIGGDEKR